MGCNESIKDAKGTHKQPQECSDLPRTALRTGPAKTITQSAPHSRKPKPLVGKSPWNPSLSPLSTRKTLSTKTNHAQLLLKTKSSARPPNQTGASRSSPPFSKVLNPNKKLIRPEAKPRHSDRLVDVSRMDSQHTAVILTPKLKPNETATFQALLLPEPFQPRLLEDCSRVRISPQRNKSSPEKVTKDNESNKVTVSAKAGHLEPLINCSERSGLEAQSGWQVFWDAEATSSQAESEVIPESSSRREYCRHDQKDDGIDLDAKVRSILAQSEERRLQSQKLEKRNAIKSVTWDPVIRLCRAATPDVVNGPEDDTFDSVREPKIDLARKQFETFLPGTPTIDEKHAELLDVMKISFSKSTPEAYLEELTETFKQLRKGSRKQIEQMLQVLRSIAYDENLASEGHVKKENKEQIPSFSSLPGKPLNPTAPAFADLGMKTNLLARTVKPENHLPPLNDRTGHPNVSEEKWQHETFVPPNIQARDFIVPINNVSAEVPIWLNTFELEENGLLPSHWSHRNPISLPRDVHGLAMDFQRPISPGSYLPSLGVGGTIPSTTFQSPANAARSVVLAHMVDHPTSASTAYQQTSGRVARVLEPAWANHVLQDFMHKYPRTGEQEQPAPGFPNRTPRLLRRIRIPRCTAKKRFASDIQQSLEYLLLQQKEKKAFEQQFGIATGLDLMDWD